MEMIDVLKRLAELDSANPTRPEHKIVAEQNIAALREVRDGAHEFSTTILNPAFIDWENGNGDENNPPEETLEVTVTYDISGSYRPATWGYHGGDPEEYPELEVMSVYDENTGQEISDRLDKATLDDINNKAWEDAEDRRNDYYENVNESKEVAECGGMSPMGASHTPASLNITANSGEELSGMLRDIMQLAGAHKVEPSELGQEPVGSTVSPAQAIAVGTSDAEDMRSVMDKLNTLDGEETDEARDIDYGAQDGGPEWERAKDFDDYPDDYPDDDEEETDEGAVYNNTPTDPNNPSAFDSEEFAHHENPPGAAKGRGNLNNPRATTMEEVEQNLFSEYQKFISEEFNDQNDQMSGLPKKELVSTFRNKWKGGDIDRAIRDTINSLYAAQYLKSSQFDAAKDFLYSVADTEEEPRKPYIDHEEDRMGLGLTHDDSRGHW